MTRRFHQVDVFTAEPYRGNPVAVVHDADGLDDRAMAAFARWTNLSETTFLLRPRDREADYALRIFTPGGEIPFAGHPTLGSAHAWLAAGGEPRGPETLVQECGVGLVRLRRADDRLAFAAPPLRRSGPLDPETLDRAGRAIGVQPGEIAGHAWIDNGPGWCALLLPSAARVLAIRPDWNAFGDLVLGVVGPQATGAETDYEVRAFAPVHGVREDPVTGSLNAGLAQWLIGAGIAPVRYRARQGTALRRAGTVFLEQVGDDVWVGGDTVTCITGEVAF